MSSILAEGWSDHLRRAPAHEHRRAASDRQLGRCPAAVQPRHVADAGLVRGEGRLARPRGVQQPPPPLTGEPWGPVRVTGWVARACAESRRTRRISMPLKRSTARMLAMGSLVVAIGVALGGLAPAAAAAQDSGSEIEGAPWMPRPAAHRRRVGGCPRRGPGDAADGERPGEWQRRLQQLLGHLHGGGRRARVRADGEHRDAVPRARHVDRVRLPRHPWAGRVVRDRPTGPDHARRDRSGDRRVRSRGSPLDGGLMDRDQLRERWARPGAAAAGLGV